MKYSTRCIAVIGNSVALRVRTSINEKIGTPYPDLIADSLAEITNETWTVRNYSASRLLSHETLLNIPQYLEDEPDYILINIGCVDAPPREIPLWFSDIVFGRKYRWLYGPSNKLYNNLIKKYLRPLLLKIRSHTPWVSREKFALNMIELLTTLLSKSKAKILVIGINPGNHRIEAALPGTKANYRDYNKILKEICNKLSITFIDVTEFDPENDTPDGVHFSQSGHARLHRKILIEMTN